MRSLKGRAAFVTGPKGNLGPIWCDALRNAGVRVFGCGLPEYDLTNEAHKTAAIEDGLKVVSNPSILIINHAIDNPPGSKARFWDKRAIIEVNFLSAVDFIEDMIPHMTAFNDHVNIVIIGSMLGFVASNRDLYDHPFDKPLGYGASKAALWNFCKNLGVREIRNGIVCNMLALTAVEGMQSEAFKKRYIERVPARRMLRREDFEDEFLMLCGAKINYEYPLFLGGGYTQI